MENMLFSFSDIVLIAGFALETGIVLQRLKVIEKKQDEHNGVVKRMVQAEKDIYLLCERQKVANHRIDDLEKQN